MNALSQNVGEIQSVILSLGLMHIFFECKVINILLFLSFSMWLSANLDASFMYPQRLLSAQPQSDALLYQQLVLCSCDIENSVKTLCFCFREVLRDCFKRTNTIEHHWQNRFFTSEHTMVKKCLKNTVMLFHLKKNCFNKKFHIHFFKRT